MSMRKSREVELLLFPCLNYVGEIIYARARKLLGDDPITAHKLRHLGSTGSMLLAVLAFRERRVGVYVFSSPSEVGTLKGEGVIDSQYRFMPYSLL
jgi:hypothetical protein